MRRALVLLFGIMVFTATFDLRAQDPQFSQFYAAPLYINPAFTGASEYTRLGVNYRNQWPNLQASFETFSFYADHYLPNANSGIGMIVTTDREGIQGLTSTNIGFSYAYQLKINDNLVFRPGLQYNFVNRNAGFQNLVFNKRQFYNFGKTLFISYLNCNLSSRFSIIGGHIAQPNTLRQYRRLSS